MPLALALSLGQTVRADFNPMPLTAGSYNADVVVERTAPPSINNFVTATMDGGTNNNAWVWYEQGYCVNSGLPATGIPTHGSTFAAVGAEDHQFQMPADYTVNNTLCLYTALPTGTLTLGAPAAFTSLSLLNGGGGGGSTITYTVHHQDGSSETGALDVYDWFNNTAVAWNSSGRITTDNGTFGNLSATPNAPYLHFNDIALANTTSPVTSIDFSSTNGNRAVIFALSGSTGAGFSPLAISGFNRDMVIEVGAPAPRVLFTATTVTMDNGTNNYDNTWYEMGLNTGTPTSGLPRAGTTFTNGSRAFTMAPSYTANDVLLVSPQVTDGTFTLSSPAAYSSLTILNSSGNAPGTGLTVNYTVHHANGGTETGTFQSYDWFNTTANPIYIANGRITVQTAGFQNVGGNACRLFAFDIALTDTISPVTSVDFNFPGTGGRTAIFAISGSTGGTFNPIAVSGYNGDIIVERTASVFPVGLYTATTASMDGGTNNTGATWFERGYYSQFPDCGLPLAGSTFSSQSLPDHHYTMASTYAANNAVYVDFAHPTANVTPASPTPLTGLSFLSATANGNVTNQCIMQYQDGTAETNLFVSVDWFNNNPYALATRGRVNLDSRSINNDPGRTGTPNPRLYEAQFALGNIASPLTNIILAFAGAANTNSGRMVVLAVSGTTGPLPPIFRTQPSSTLVMEGSNVVLSVVSGGGTPPISYQWQVGTNNVFVNLADGGTISGSASTALSFSSIGWTNAAQYRLIASNPAGYATSAVATVTVLSGLPDVTVPTDPIVAYQPNGGSSPGTEGVANAIDNTTTKYLNFAAGTTPFVGPIGFTVTPAMGSTILNLLRFYTANDSEGRDPASYVLEGSNDGGNTWSTISSGSLALPAARNNSGLPLNPLTAAMQEVRFPNASGFTSYRVSFPTIKDNAGTSLLQIGEVELLGYLNPIPPIIVRQPLATVTVFVGAAPSFSVAAEGPPPLSYQWYVNGSTPISGATSAFYTLSPAQATDSGKTFSCRVTNPYGTTTSSSSTLVVTARPTNPYPLAVLNDNPMAFFRLDEPDDGAGNNGVAALDRAGGHNGVYSNTVLNVAGYNPIADTDTAALFGQFLTPAGVQDNYAGGIDNLSFATPTNTGTAFSLEAWVQGPVQTSDAGIITKGSGGGGEQFNLDCGGSDPAHLFRFFVRDASGNTHGATATKGPDGAWHHVVGVCDELHSNVVLYVDGIQSGGAGSVLPWQGILSSTHPVSIGSRQSNATTNYDLQFNGTVDDVAVYSYALSSNQVLAHYFAANPAPAFSLQPTNTTAAEGSTATLYSLAYGPGTVTYQWYQSADGGATFAPLAGQTTANLTWPSVPAANNGYYYYAVAANAYGSATSSIVTLTVISGPPQILTDLPTAGLVYAGRTAVLTVQVSGTVPFTYQWTKDGVNLSDTARITGAHSNILSIANAQLSDSGSYQLTINNVHGSANSQAEALTVQARPAFNNNGLGWTLNGNPTAATINNNVLVLTYGAGGTARSAYFNYALNISAFSAAFTYQDTTPSGGGADGFAFVLQNSPAGAAALGGGGGALGYGGLTPSVALMFNIYSGSPGGQGISLGVNGTRLYDYSPTGPVNLGSGDPINVNISYAQGLATVTLTDTLTTSSFTTNFNLGDLVAMLGSDTAYVGLSGADGGIASNQQVSNLAFLSYPVVTAQLSGSSTVTLSWPASIGGYLLQQKSTLTGGTWQTVVAPVNVVNGQNQVAVPAAGEQQFFRLTLP